MVGRRRGRERERKQTVGHGICGRGTCRRKGPGQERARDAGCSSGAF